MADERPVLWRTALQAAFVVCYLYRGRCLCYVLQAEEWLLFFCHGLNGLDGLNGFMSYLEAKQKPNKPLGEDGGRCTDVMLPPWSYKSELLTPKPKACAPPSS